MQYKVTFLQLTALVHAYKHFPSIVPKQWHLVSQFVAKYSMNFSEHSPITESVLPNLPSMDCQTTVMFSITQIII